MKLLDAINGGARPLWHAALVLALLLGFGYLQEGVKMRLNHYIEVAQMNPDFASSDPESRSQWWAAFAPPATDGLFSTRSTFAPWHQLSLSELVRLKWLLAAVIVALFFALDAALLWTLGVAGRWKSLAAMYAATGAVVFIFYALDRGDGGPGYHVAREALGFLQSPLPSLFLIFIPALHSQNAPH